jgi:zinc protease
VSIGKIGAARRSPDYFALVLMNSVLGGQFASRINLNLREDKGYSYGAASSFAFLRGPGPFEAGGPVQTAATAEALVEFFKEIRDITGRRPITDAELAFAKERIIQGFPSRFETTFGVAGQIAVLAEYDLPDDEFARYQSRIEAVTQSEVNRVAREYITPDQMTILVVGDRAQIERPLKRLPFVAAVQLLDREGNPLPAPAAKAAAAAGNGSATRRRVSALIPTASPSGHSRESRR